MDKVRIYNGQAGGVEVQSYGRFYWQVGEGPLGVRESSPSLTASRCALPPQGASAGDPTRYRETVMAATDKIDHLETMREAVSILRGENRAWKGDRIYNAEFFLYCLARDLSEAAAGLADDLEANAGDYSELLGISPDRVRWCANRLRH